jgi:hypothetical protein
LNGKLEFAKPDVKTSIILISLLAGLVSFSLATVQSIESSFEINNLKVEPIEAKVGEIVTITADVTNIGNTTSSHEAMLVINDEKEGLQTVTLAPNETKSVEFTYTPAQEGSYNITISDESAEFNVLAPSEPKFRMGPVVRLRPVNDVISSSKDGLVELFFSNPAHNEGITLRAEVWISVPSDIHIYGEGFALASGAGTIYGQFEVLPGTARTIYMNVKADQTTVGKTYFIHFFGFYYPNEDIDNYNSISLTHPFKIVDASPNPYDPAPTDPDQISKVIDKPQTGGLFIGWSGVTLWIILAAVILGIALIALARR